MRKILLPLSLFTLTLLLTSCFEKKIEPEPPGKKIPVKIINKELSWLQVPIELNINLVQALMEKKLPSNLFRVSGMKLGSGLSLQIGLRRNGRIRLSFNGNKIQWSVPTVIYDGRVDYEHCKRIKFGIGSKRFCGKHHMDFGGSFDINGITTLMVNKNWNIISSTRLSHAWNQKFYVVLDLKIGKTTISISKIADQFIKPQINKIGKKIDNKISKIKLRPKIQKVWNSFHQVRKLNRNPDVWAKITPKSFALLPLTSKDNKIIITPFASAKLEVLLSKPITQTPRSLPGLKLESGKKDKVKIYIPVVAKFSDIREVFRSRINGRPYPLKNKKKERIGTLKIIDTDIYGNGDDVVVGIQFYAKHKKFGKFKGKIYLIGEPYYNFQKQLFKVKNLDYDLKTKNILLKLADFIKHDDFVKSIEESLEYPVADKLLKAKQNAEKFVKEKKIGKYVTIHGSIQRFEPIGILVNSNQIEIHALAEGKAKVLVKNDNN